MPLRSECSEAILLRRRELKETDRILVFYTKEYGKLSAVAKGVRRSRSKMGSALEPLSAIEGVFYRKPNAKLATLTQAETIASHKAIREDILRFAAAQVLAETVERLTPEEHPDPTLYDLLFFFSSRIADAKNPETILHVGQLKILSALGYAPEVFQSVVSEKTIKDPCYFSPSRGGVVSKDERVRLKDARPISEKARAFIAASLTTPSEKTILFRLTSETGREIRRLLKDYLEFHVNVRLKSEDFLEEILTPIQNNV